MNALQKLSEITQTVVSTIKHVKTKDRRQNDLKRLQIAASDTPDSLQEAAVGEHDAVAHAIQWQKVCGTPSWDGFDVTYHLF
jgi:hypothetical protein